MARTKLEIETEILAEIATLVPSLNSPSLFALFLFFAQIMASAIYTFEKILDAHKKEVDSLVINQVHGNPAWYHAQSLKFQYGYALVLNTANYQYYYTDTTSVAAIASKIITKSVAVAINGNLLFKVAKGTSPSLTKLTNVELTAFKAYLKHIQLAGDNVAAISYDADIIRLRMQLYYDGQLEVIALKNAVVAAIELYLLNLDFNGQIVTSDLIQTIKEVPGVFDCVFYSSEIKPETGGYTAFTRTADGLSGHYKLKPLGTTVDDTNIDMIPQ